MHNISWVASCSTATDRPSRVDQHMPADKDDELFEIVDDTNQVIGTERRGIVHRTGLLHRAVYCFVFNSQGEVLLQQRSAQYVSCAAVLSLHVQNP